MRLLWAANDATRPSLWGQLQSPAPIGCSLSELAGTSKEPSTGRRGLALRSVLSWGQAARFLKIVREMTIASDSHAMHNLFYTQQSIT